VKTKALPYLGSVFYFPTKCSRVFRNKFCRATRDTAAKVDDMRNRDEPDHASLENSGSGQRQKEQRRYLWATM
jgi:hypothetical protein